MKILLTRTLPLLLCIALGTALSWVSIYAFYFSAVLFHSVPAVRVCDAIGSFILFPARTVFQLLGGDQSSIFFDATSFSGANGLILGILFYSLFRVFWNHREAAKAAPHNGTVANHVALGR